MVAGLWTGNFREWSWRAMFLLGLLGGGALALVWRPELFGSPPADRSLGLLARSGFLVGLGASMSNGCTSGHGVCGLGRRSLRSLAATLIFMTAGIVTVAVINHLKG